MCNVWRLLRTCTWDEKQVDPSTFIAANGELLNFAIGISYVITSQFNPEFLRKNPIKCMVGYNNPCVTWDSMPARPFAALVFMPTVYFAIRFAILASHQGLLIPGMSRSLRVSVYIVNTIYAISAAILCMIFVVPPATPAAGPDTLPSLRLHSACWLQFIPCFALAILMRFVQASKMVKVSCLQWMIVVVFVTVSLLEFTMAATAVFKYQNTCTPVHDLWRMKAVDWTHFATIPFVAWATPSTAPLDVSIQMADPESQVANARVVGNLSSDFRTKAGFQPVPVEE